jgi:CheY-like chemotaxis protein
MDILLIEDDLRMAELISIGLRDNGHNVRLATDEIDGYMQYIAIHPLKQNFQCLKARYKKDGTSILIAVPPQHKHKIKHDKTTMQSYLFMPGRHK